MPGTCVRHAVPDILSISLDNDRQSTYLGLKGLASVQTVATTEFGRTNVPRPL